MGNSGGSESGPEKELVIDKLDCHASFTGTQDSAFKLHECPIAVRIVSFGGNLDS